MPRESAVTMWAFTYFPEREDESLREWMQYQFNSGMFSYMSGQAEAAPDTGRIHLQGFAQTAKRVRMAQLSELNKRVHWEHAKDPEAARRYSMKEASRVDGPWELGEWRKPGRKTTLEDACKLVLEGKSDYEIAQVAPMQFVRHYKGIRELRIAAKIQGYARDWEPEIWVLFGPSRTGKSWFAKTNWPDAYWKPKGPWWDGYNAEETVVLDDFRGSWFSLTECQQLLDRYPLRVQTKGGTVPMLAKRYIITSNRAPSTWYADDEAQSILGRINDYAVGRFVWTSNKMEWFDANTNMPWEAPAGVKTLREVLEQQQLDAVAHSNDLVRGTGLQL